MPRCSLQLGNGPTRTKRSGPTDSSDMFPGASPQSLPVFCLRAFKLTSQNDLKPTIRQRFGEKTPGRGVAFPGAELGAIPQQFAPPDTKGPPAHYTVPVDGTGTRITHCSLPHFLLREWNPCEQQIYKGRASFSPGLLITQGGLWNDDRH